MPFYHLCATNVYIIFIIASHCTFCLHSGKTLNFLDPPNDNTAPFYEIPVSIPFPHLPQIDAGSLVSFCIAIEAPSFTRVEFNMAHFSPPLIQDNPDGWGPCAVPAQFKDIPYQPFSKGDRIGKVSLFFTRSIKELR